MTRRFANIWWVALGAGLALELAWCELSGQHLWPQGVQVGISSHEFNTGRGKVGYTVGSDVGRWLPRGQAPVQFVVIEGPSDPAKQHYRGGDRVVFDANRTSRMWLPVTRTRLINVNNGSPQSYTLDGERVAARPLPPGFSVADFEQFLGSPEAKVGAEGWARWLGRRRQ